MSVSEGWPSLSVANMGDGGFSRSMISRRAADTARMSCGLWKIVLARGLLSLRMLAGGGIGRSAVRGREDDWVCVGAVGNGTACWITAGAGGGLVFLHLLARWL